MQNRRNSGGGGGNRGLSQLALLLISRACENEEVANFLFWYLKLEAEVRLCRLLLFPCCLLLVTYFGVCCLLKCPCSLLVVAKVVVLLLKSFLLLSVLVVVAADAVVAAASMFFFAEVAVAFCSRWRFYQQRPCCHCWRCSMSSLSRTALSPLLSSQLSLSLCGTVGAAVAYALARTVDDAVAVFAKKKNRGTPLCGRCTWACGRP